MKIVAEFFHDVHIMAGIIFGATVVGGRVTHVRVLNLDVTRVILVLEAVLILKRNLLLNYGIQLLLLSRHLLRTTQLSTL